MVQIPNHNNPLETEAVLHQHTETNVVTKVVNSSPVILETIGKTSDIDTISKSNLVTNTDQISVLPSTNTRRRSSSALTAATKRNNSLRAIRRRFSAQNITGKIYAKT